MGEYHEGNKVPGYDNHKGGNQWFTVNNDRTVSPTHAPYMVFGIKGSRKEESKFELILVKNTDEEDKLVFENLKPSYDLSSLKVMALKMSSHKGKAIVIKDSLKQHGHGME